jgi:hypothetical protein
MKSDDSPYSIAKVAKTSVVDVGDWVKSAATLLKNNPYVRKMARHELYRKKARML